MDAIKVLSDNMGVVLGTCAVVALCSYLYSGWQSTAERLTKRTGKNGDVLLPSPKSMLPDYFGYVGGHGLMLDTPRVSEICESMGKVVLIEVLIGGVGTIEGSLLSIVPVDLCSCRSCRCDVVQGRTRSIMLPA